MRRRRLPEPFVFYVDECLGRDAIRRVGAGIILLGEASGVEQARRIVTALPLLRRVARTHDLAFIARLVNDGTVVVLYEAGERLPTPKRLRLKASER